MTDNADLLVNLDVTLKKYLAKLDRASAESQKAAKRIQSGFESGNKKIGSSFKSAEASASIFTKEIERLRTKYDPLYASSKRYEAELKQINVAHKIGALNAKTHQNAIALLNAKYMATGLGLTTSTKGVSGFTSVLNRNRHAVQNSAFQLQDIIVQIQAGQGVTRALSQQVPQLLGGFGALGAVFGVVAGLGIPLVAMLLAMRDGAEANADPIKRAEEALKGLSDAVGVYTRTASLANASIEEQREAYGHLTASAREALDVLESLDKLAAQQSLKTAASAVVDSFGNIPKVVNDLDVLKAKIDQISNDPSYNDNEFGDLFRQQDVAPYAEQLKFIEELTQKYSLNNEQIKTFVDLLNQIDQAQSVEGLRDALEDIFTLFDDVTSEAGELSAPLKTAYADLRKLYDQTTEFVGAEIDAANAADNIAFSVGGIDFSNAISGAYSLTAALGGALDALAKLEGGQAAALRRAQITQQFVGDPVGLAGALARDDALTPFKEADPTFGRPDGNLSAGQVSEIKSRVQELGDLAEQTEATKLRTQELNRILAASAKPSGGRKSGGSNKRERDLGAELIERGQDEIEKLEEQIQYIGLSAEATAALKFEQEALNKAKEAGINLDQVINANGDTFRSVISQQADEVARLTKELETNKLAWDFVENSANKFTDGIINGIIAGENLADTFKQITASILADLAKQIAQIAIRNALEAAFGGSGGGGLLGGIGALFNANGNVFDQSGHVTAFANGGVVNGATPFTYGGGRLGVLGEAGPEAILPLTRGANGKLGVQVQGGQSGGGEIVVHINASSDFDARVETISGNVSARTVQSQATKQVAGAMTNPNSKVSRAMAGANGGRRAI